MTTMLDEITTYEWMTDRPVPLVTPVPNGTPLFDDSPPMGTMTI
jgi:hypothetical protein